MAICLESCLVHTESAKTSLIYATYVHDSNGIIYIAIKQYVGFTNRFLAVLNYLLGYCQDLSACKAFISYDQISLVLITNV